MVTRGVLLTSAALIAVPTLSVSLITLLTTKSNNPYILLGYGLVIGLISVGPLTKGLMESDLISTQLGIKVMVIAVLAEVLGILAFNSILNLNLLTIMASLALLYFVYRIGRRIFILFTHEVDRVFLASEASFAIIDGLIIITGYLAEYLKFSAALTSLLLGVTASSYLRERPDYIEKLRAFTYGFLEPLFFAGIGLYMSRIDLTVLALFITMFPITLITKVLVGYTAVKNWRLSFAFLSKGGVDAALLISLYPLLSSYDLPHLYGVGLLTIMASALLTSVTFYGRGVRRVKPSFWNLKVSDVMILGGWVLENVNLLRVSSLLLLYPAVVVVDQDGEPVGYISAQDLIHLNPRDYRDIKAAEVYRWPVPIVRKDYSVRRLIEMIGELDIPVVAVVNEHGKIIGIVDPHALLSKLLRH